MNYDERSDVGIRVISKNNSDWPTVIGRKFSHHFSNNSFSFLPVVGVEMVHTLPLSVIIFSHSIKSFSQ